MRRAVLAASTGFRVMVHRYAVAEHHRPHTDRFARISFPLRGRYREQVAAGATTVGPGDVTFKSRAVVHEDWFGDEGSTVASVELCDDGDETEDALVRLAGRMWMIRRDRAALRLVLDLLDAAVAGDLAGVDTTATDLLSAGSPAPQRRSAPPPWLVHLKEELELEGLAATHVGARARAAGVHPVHASRLFRSCFGVTITAHALEHGVRRALVGMNDGRVPLSRVAADAGFYDQSHMNRVFRAVLGRSPGRVRRACAVALARVG